MDIVKLIKKPIGKTKIEYYVTVSGQDVSEAIDYCLDIIAHSTRTYVPEDQDAETLLRKRIGDDQFEYLLRHHVMGRISPFVISHESGLDNMAFEPECSCTVDPQRDEDFTFTIHVLLKPKYELTSYDPIEITVPRYTIPEIAIDARIDQIAQMSTTYKKIDDKGNPVELGQFVTIDMRVTQNGQEVPGLTGDGRLLQLDYNFMPKSFVDPIVGMKVGETKTFKFEGPRDPDNLEDTETFRATITIKDLQKQIAPKISNAWVEVHMPEAGTLEGLRAQIREEFEAKAKQMTDQELSAMADAVLAERFSGSIDDEAYETAANSIYRNIGTNLQQQGKTLDQFLQEQGLTQQQLNMQVMLQARDIIRQGFALDKLFEVKIGELTEEDLQEAYHAFAPGHEEEAKQQFIESNRLYAVREVAKRLCAHKYLVQNATIEYKDVEVPMDTLQQMLMTSMPGMPGVPQML